MKHALGMTLLMGFLVLVLTGMAYLQPAVKQDVRSVQYELKGFPQLPVPGQRDL